MDSMDDLVLVVGNESMRELKKKVLRWKECMEENELKININKTDVSFMEELW